HEPAPRGWAAGRADGEGGERGDDEQRSDNEHRREEQEDAGAAGEAARRREHGAIDRDRQQGEEARRGGKRKPAADASRPWRRRCAEDRFASALGAPDHPAGGLSQTVKPVPALLATPRLRRTR